MFQVITAGFMGIFITWMFAYIVGLSRVWVNDGLYIRAVDVVKLILVNAVGTLVSYGVLSLVNGGMKWI